MAAGRVLARLSRRTDGREGGGEPDVLQHTEVAEQPAALGQDADLSGPQPGRGSGTAVAEPHAADQYLPAVGVIEPGQQPERSELTGPDGPVTATVSPAAQLQRDIKQGSDLGVPPRR